MKEENIDCFGHVNNAEYLSLLEQARWEWLTEIGFGLNEVLKLKKGPIVLSLNIEFKRELLLRNSYSIHTEAKRPDRKIFQVHQEIKNDQNEIYCQAVFTAGFFDLETRKLIEPINQWKEAVKSQ